ncbi:MAG: 30S ribosomal protein S6 [Nitrospirota bacterium]
MNYYEKVMIVDPNLDDSAVDEAVGKVKDIILKEGGEILKTDNWGRRKLAYELNKRKQGNYVLILFKSPPTTIGKLEKHCKLFETIIKFMIVKLVKPKHIEAALPKPAAAPAKAEAPKEAPVKKEPAKAAEETAPPAEDK